MNSFKNNRTRQSVRVIMFPFLNPFFSLSFSFHLSMVMSRDIKKKPLLFKNNSYYFDLLNYFYSLLGIRGGYKW